MSDDERRGLILARHRREVIVEDSTGRSWQGLLRGRRLRALTGDEVLFAIEPDGTAVIDTLLPRRTVLERIDSRGQPEGVAANVSLLAIVAAPLPPPDWQMIDRYLVAAVLMRVDAAIVLNKCDLGDDPIKAALERYSRLGYSVCRTSTVDGSGLDELRRLLSGHRSVLVGQSGTGKSSLLNALLADTPQAVRSLSRRRPLGRHTTTSAVLHRLPDGGELIDSPGVRRFAPAIPDGNALAQGFLEFRPCLGQCRFNDCRHLDDAGCAVTSAVTRGEIAPERYRSYAELRKLIERLA